MVVVVVVDDRVLPMELLLLARGRPPPPLAAPGSAMIDSDGRSTRFRLTRTRLLTLLFVGLCCDEMFS